MHMLGKSGKSLRAESFQRENRLGRKEEILRSRPKPTMYKNKRNPILDKLINNKIKQSPKRGTCVGRQSPFQRL